MKEYCSDYIANGKCDYIAYAKIRVSSQDRSHIIRQILNLIFDKNNTARILLSIPLFARERKMPIDISPKMKYNILVSY